MKKLLVLILLCFSLPLMASEGSLNLKLKDGTIHTFLLSAEPKITFSDEVIHFVGKDISMSFGKYEVSEYSFGVSNGIGEIQPKGSHQFVNGDLVIGDSKDAKISVYDLTGRRLHCETNSVGNTCTIRLSCLRPSVYVVKVNNLSIKIRTK